MYKQTMSINDKCSICCKEFNNTEFILTSCDHFVHAECLEEWKK